MFIDSRNIEWNFIWDVVKIKSITVKTYVVMWYEIANLLVNFFVKSRTLM